MNIFSSVNKIDTNLKKQILEKNPRYKKEGLMRNKWKNYTVIVNVTQTACSNCKELSKLIYIDDVFSKGKKNTKYPLLSVAIKRGLLVDGCHAQLLTFFEGINSPPQ